ncbi:MAG: hypothetical protein M5U34_29155 [Chloroflexi bacterium]|nr:hypothetical protein [Chloroflexota bacterium]
MVSDTILLDASYRHLADASGPLKHNMEVKLFVGAAEVVARTRVLGAAHINPGETGWLQLALSEPVAISRRDRFILRRPSPGETLGGGLALDPHPGDATAVSGQKSSSGWKHWRRARRPNCCCKPSAAWSQ